MRFVTSCIEDVLTEMGVALPVTQKKASEPAPMTEVNSTANLSNLHYFVTVRQCPRASLVLTLRVWCLLLLTGCLQCQMSVHVPPVFTRTQ